MSTTTMERCEAAPGGMIQCREIAVGYFNTKAADGRLRDFPLCQVHLDAWRQADRRDEEQKAQKHEQERVDRAREAFVTAWRAKYPDSVALPPWICDLCGTAVQIGKTDDDAQDGSFMQHRVGRHQRSHGTDWLDYIQIGAPREAASQGERE